MSNSTLSVGATPLEDFELCTGTAKLQEETLNTWLVSTIALENCNALPNFAFKRGHVQQGSPSHNEDDGHDYVQ